MDQKPVGAAWGQKMGRVKASGRPDGHSQGADGRPDSWCGEKMLTFSQRRFGLKDRPGGVSANEAAEKAGPRREQNCQG